MTTLYLVRHGETVDNANQIMQGQTQGQLNDNGIKQAQDEIAQKGNYMYNVINDTLDRCADEVKKIIRKELGAL